MPSVFTSPTNERYASNNTISSTAVANPKNDATNLLSYHHPPRDDLNGRRHGSMRHHTLLPKHEEEELHPHHHPLQKSNGRTPAQLSYSTPSVVRFADDDRSVRTLEPYQYFQQHVDATNTTSWNGPGWTDQNTVVAEGSSSSFHEPSSLKQQQHGSGGNGGELKRNPFLFSERANAKTNVLAAYRSDPPSLPSPLFSSSAHYYPYGEEPRRRAAGESVVAGSSRQGGQEDPNSSLTTSSSLLLRPSAVTINANPSLSQREKTVEKLQAQLDALLGEETIDEYLASQEGILRDLSATKLRLTKALEREATLRAVIEEMKKKMSRMPYAAAAAAAEVVSVEKPSTSRAVVSPGKGSAATTTTAKNAVASPAPASSSSTTTSRVYLYEKLIGLQDRHARGLLQKLALEREAESLKSEHRVVAQRASVLLSSSSSTSANTAVTDLTANPPYSHNEERDAYFSGDVNSVQQAAWQLRGRIADLDRRISEKDRLLEELEQAISTVELELEALPPDATASSSSASAAHHAGAGAASPSSVGSPNARQQAGDSSSPSALAVPVPSGVCAQCLEPTRMYPFCPATGAPHPDDDIEDDGGDPAQGRSPGRRRRRHTSASGSPDRAGGTQAVYAGAKSAEALRALDKGDWKVLVEVGSCAISFQDCRTGAIVASLDDELERRRWTSAELGKRLEVHQQRMGPLAAPTPAPAPAAAARWSTSLPPAVAQEIQTLLAVVKEKNDHIAKLKVLLKRLVGTASVGLLTATPSAPGGEGGSSVGGALSLWYEPIASSASASPSTAAVSAPPTTSVATSFEQRVVELQIELSNRDRRVAQLEEEVHRLRWGSGGEGDRRDGGGEETTASDGSLRVSSTSGVDRRRMTDIDAMRVLENELAETKQMWLLDRRRVQTLHEELQAAQKRKNGMERK